MKKLAANYLVSEAGEFLKNGILFADKEGFAVEFIDTKGDLREIEQLIFYNGILMVGCLYKRTNSFSAFPETKEPFTSFLFNSIYDSTQLSLHELIELGKQVQVQFPEMRIPAIWNKITEVLLIESGYIKESVQGIYLLKGVDLVELHFTPYSHLKKIL